MTCELHTTKPPSIKDLYKLSDVIGKGHFSTVRRAWCYSDNQHVAVKILKKHRIEYNKIMDEIGILRSLNHPHIIKFFDAIESSSKLYVIMELAKGGELFEKIIELHHYSVSSAACIIRQMLFALQYLHQNNIVHRDLKPENLLLSTDDPDSEIKISDFGLAEVVDKQSLPPTQSISGTIPYLAPEVILKQRVGTSADVWSLGVVCFTLLAGFPPFFCEDQQELMHQIVCGDYSFPSPYCDHFTAEAKDLIARMLVLDPQHRITASEALNHPFLTQSRSTQPIQHLNSVLDQMKVYNTKRRMKKAVTALSVVYRLRRSLSVSMDKFASPNSNPNLNFNASEGDGNAEENIKCQEPQ
ncbi:hypothetical protein P9112_009049 [Eukaryota sp. TZLM1-RC]